MFATLINEKGKILSKIEGEGYIYGKISEEYKELEVGKQYAFKDKEGNISHVTINVINNGEKLVFDGDNDKEPDCLILFENGDGKAQAFGLFPFGLMNKAIGSCKRTGTRHIEVYSLEGYKRIKAIFKIENQWMERKI